ncbi:methyl-accepting chemotaxis protein [Marinobacter sp. C2H3]|uniref:methyl-accepting chemotaxis protein n=1 Tax=Marinobacter sp. C2H3 TaxID=3119003 RepID=UPI00300F7103
MRIHPGAAFLNASVRTKLLSGFCLVLLLMCIMAFVALTQTRQLTASSDQLSGIARITEHFLSARVSEKNLQLRNDSAEGKNAQSEISDALKRTDDLEAAAFSPEQADRFNTLTDTLKGYQGFLGNLAQAVSDRAGGGEANLSDKALERLDQQMVTQARQADDLIATAYDAQRAAMGDLESRTRTFIWVALAAAVVLGLGIALIITTLITRPLDRIVGQAEYIANGDLTHNLEPDRKDELGRLMTVIQTMTVNLRALIKELQDGVTQIASSSEELSAVTEQTSAGARQQREETDQAATAMNEMTATVHEVSQNAASAAQSAEMADEHAKEGFHLVKQTAKQVDTLSDDIEASKTRIQTLNADVGDIGKILDVIDGIAEQTNLLALNAAIEAARAGEHGRGFAVVADEVRGLAQRTQSSVEQIEELINRLKESAEQAVHGMDRNSDSADAAVVVVRNAGEALKTIAEAVSNIQGMNHQIAAAVEQQSSVAESINQGVVTIREVTDQSATANEQIAIASNELAKLGADLHRSVARFAV